MVEENVSLKQDRKDDVFVDKIYGNVPQLRFPEFEDEWLEYKIGELFDIKAAGDLKKENFSKIKTNKFKYPLYGNALEKEGLMGYSNNKKYNSTITVTGRGDIGKAFVRNHDFDAVGRLLILNKKGNVNLEFVTEYINNKLRIYLESTGVPQLTAPQFKSYKIKLPSLSEQNKLGLFFNLINEKIMLLEKTYSLYKSIKKYFLKNILSKNIRFPNFDDEWDLKKISDVAYIPKKNKLTNIDNLRLLTVKLHCKGIEFNDNIKPKLSKRGRPYYKRKTNELLIGRQNFHNGGMGIVKKEHNNGICSNAISSFINYENKISINFLYNYISQPDFYKKAEKYTGGTGQKEFSEKQLLNLKILVPSIAEQIKINKFIEKIDEKINCYEKQIEEYSLFKKELLNKMFI